MCEPEDRLGSESASEIKAHHFFAGVDFDSLRRIAAPFKPHLASETDTTHFPTEEELANNALQMAGAAKDSAATGAGAGGSGSVVPGTVADAPEMTLPFIGYTFKRFEEQLGGVF
jgi:protein-serine/threonine kinase